MPIYPGGFDLWEAIRAVKALRRGLTLISGGKTVEGAQHSATVQPDHVVIASDAVRDPESDVPRKVVTAHTESNSNPSV
jgi:hypothetical protein